MIRRFVPTCPAEARGRNGYFKVGEIALWRNAYDGTLNVEVSSTRPGKAAPCRIKLAPEDAHSLARLIQDACCDPSDMDGRNTEDG